MAGITAAMVKELRTKTGAGMMDCKKALGENDGDVEAAIDWLRKKGLAAAAKKSGRVASEGLIGVVANGTRGAMVEVNSETDFVARNDQFQGFVGEVAKITLAAGSDVDAIKASDFPGAGRTVEEQVTHLIATIGENMSLRRAVALEVSEGYVGSYVHGAVSDGIGKIGVLVALQSSASEDVLAPLAKHIAMHVAATAPQSLTVEDLDPQLIEREKTIFSDQARASGKPDNIIEKMIEGRMRKYYEEVVLLRQVSVVDGENRIEQVVEAAAKAAGTPITLTAFSRFALGEGVEKEETDFAAEVKAAAGV
ncbi:elongation factor Ts [Iodidimonas gelatinilytica]|uniref:Elongation factor Ts n=2 Tax=Iodidimonas gelatinilytica TaxID=1236966 RepID=A0A5A7MNW8_9PROT|nr:translation elongation factor Ts [Iodidimonas gelatinilytica]GEQ96843.1 elongation factor Ts [Iodidimonas gelatinilytica]